MIEFYLLIFALSFSLTWLLRRYAIATSLVDIPNDRSSHVVPTPRGGGISFVFCFLGAVSLLFIFKSISYPTWVALIGAGSFIAALGFLDDLGRIPVKWRLLGYFAISGFALYLLDGMAAISFFGRILPAGLFANIFAVFYLTWLLNLYNFMDGIDGIAAIETISVCLSAALLYYFQDNNNAMLLPLSLAFAVAGFLFWYFCQMQPWDLVNVFFVKFIIFFLYI